VFKEKIMGKIKFVSKITFNVVLVAVLLSTSMVLDAQKDIVFSTAETESYRQELLETMYIYTELGGLMESSNILSATDEAIRQIEKLSHEDISVFLKAGVDISILRNAVRGLKDKIGAKVSREAAMKVDTVSSSGFPDASYSNRCGCDRLDTEDFFAARMVYKVAQGVWSAASRGCDQVFTTPLGVYNTSTLCIIVDTAFFVAQVVFDELENCDNDIDSAEIEGTYERTAHIHGDLETVDGKIEVVDGKIEVVDGKIDALEQKINDLTAAVEDLRRVNCELMRLLHIPQGQRSSDCSVCSDQPGYPYKWSAKK
jgi:hypothetical protein